MKPAILIVDHGSRRPEANTLVTQLAERVRRRVPDRVVEVAHMELAEPTVAQGLAACAEAGASQVVVHPYFLGPGRHTTQSIPQLVEEAARTLPGLRIRISEPLGLHESLVDVVLARVDQAAP